jgi:hypothetical protein
MRTLNNQHYAKYRNQQILYKRRVYKEKYKYSIFLNRIKIRGLSKHMSNRLIKVALEKKQLQIELNESKQISLEDFYDKYNFKDNLKLIEIDTIFRKDDKGYSFCCDIEKDKLLHYFDTHNLILQFNHFGSYLEKNENIL